MELQAIRSDLAAGIDQAARRFQAFAADYVLQARYLADIQRHLTADGLSLQIPVWQVEARKR